MACYYSGCTSNASIGMNAMARGVVVDVDQARALSPESLTVGRCCLGVSERVKSVATRWQPNQHVMLF